MADILVVAEIVEGALKKATLSAITFAREASKALGGGFAILAIGEGAEKVASGLSGFGAAKVLVADDPSLKGYVAERFAPTIADAAKSFGVVVMTATATGKDLMPRVAAKLAAGYAADISAFKSDGGKLSYKRPMFAGNAYGWMKIETAQQVVTVRQTEFNAAEPSGGSSQSEQLAISRDPAADKIEFLYFDVLKSERPALT